MDLKVWKKLEDIRWDKLFSTMQCIGFKYINFTSEEFSGDETILSILNLLRM